MFSAVVIQKDDDGRSVGVSALDDSDLPDGDVTVDVEYSTLNYKDGLAILGTSPVVRTYPMVPGIDFAGVVSASTHASWQPGDVVVLNGWGVGETHWGGLAQRARVNGDWLIPLPAGLTTRQTMALGTAGYTAALCVDALVAHGVSSDSGDVLVTGATGGVGTVVIALLARAGFSVTASTGSTSEEAFLTGLGATAVIDRAELSEPGKPLQKERWAGVVDSVGSTTLVNACAQTRYGGAVAACGLAQGMDFAGTVAPFILRGVSLLGIDSVRASRARRVAAWERLARDLDASVIDAIADEVALADVVSAAQQLMDGKIRGRVLVRTS
ncbi:MDR family oxidoreductase [Cryptosporangium phraense]|uniref:Oxidoreductase n=1 Tax=Cryptosporangium phraense TaxID=2593070 RepID=A0A545ARM1_9ACTN|nr:MDR family oxidoreductase [Cryptosporangium phraense]TQS43335.1 oxidoreductase [Cryptosporangium phraense]